jgi:murein L,D-transpeptidase YafK
LVPLLVLFAVAGSRAEAQVPATHGDFVPHPNVSKVVVVKSERKLKLLDGESVIREFEISLGRQPKGAKLRSGDGRTPEGEYVLDWRNPNSQFYRSIHVSYPNDIDRSVARSMGVAPGGMIMIHGQPLNNPYRYAKLKGDWTEGCIAVSNAAMDEIWESVEDGTPIEIRP